MCDYEPDSFTQTNLCLLTAVSEDTNLVLNKANLSKENPLKKPVINVFIKKGGNGKGKNDLNYKKSFKITT